MSRRFNNKNPGRQIDMGKRVCFVDRLTRGSPETHTWFGEAKARLGDGPFPPLERKEIDKSRKEQGGYDYLVAVNAGHERAWLPNTFLRNVD